MELKPGYKQTEMGVIPSDWDVAQLGEVSTSSSGTTPARSLHDRYYKSGMIPWVKTLDLNDAEISDTDEKVTELALKETSLRVNPEGSVLVAMYGGFNQIGRTGLLKVPAAVNQALTAVQPNHARVVPRFLLDVLNYKVEYWKSVASSSRKDPNITGADVRAFPLQLPPLAEQSAIAAALGDVDALLSALDALIAKQRDLKAAAMQQLLTGKTRLPGFAGKWEMKRLDALADIRSGGTPSTNMARFWGGGIPWCTPTDITILNGGKYLSETSRTISQDGLVSSSAEMIPANSVVMTSRATIGECAINTVPVTTNQGFKNFVPLASTDVEFLYYLLQTQKQGFIRLCAGSTFLEIGKTQLAAYEVRLPPTKEEQTAIAAVLSDMDAQLAALEQRREKTRLLKQGMMQELLTGRTRLLQSVAQPVSNVVPFPKPEANTAERKAPVAFVRSVFAAEIVERLHAEPTFGHVKFEKLIYLAEHMCMVDIGANYHRDAAGPYDNRALRSIDSQLKKSRWFEAQKIDGRYQYLPLEKHGSHKPYFDRYFADVSDLFDKVIDTFKNAKTEQCEIVATLYEAWYDLLVKNAAATDDAIVDQVLNHWHDDKKRISEDRWRKALDWMREKGFVPEGSASEC